MEKMTILMASDHAGYAVKRHVRLALAKQGHTVRDLGPDDDTAPVDYPDYAHALARALAKEPAAVGIAVCGSGQGIGMSLNRHANVRAALCWNAEIAALARRHNDANVCVLPGRFTSLADAERIAQTFLAEPFEGGRHTARVAKINPRD